MFDWFDKKARSPMAEAFTTHHDMVATGHPGLISGTMVATAQGWRCVDTLAAGDEVLTFDNGLYPLKQIQHRRVSLDQTGNDAMMTPIYVPRDAMGNRFPLWLRADQGILLEHDLVEDALGDPFAVLPACTLEGYRGITRSATQVHMDLVQLTFDEDEVVYVEDGMLAYCPSKRDLLQISLSPEDHLYTVMPKDDARELVIDMITEDKFWTPDMVVPGGQGTPQFAMHT